jgi:hypothetical protein
MTVVVGFAVLTVVVMKSSRFWDIKPHSPLKINHHFGGIYSLHLQGQRINQVRNQDEGGSELCIVSQKTELFMIAVACYILTRNRGPEHCPTPICFSLQLLEYLSGLMASATHFIGNKCL